MIATIFVSNRDARREFIFIKFKLSFRRRRREVLLLVLLTLSLSLSLWQGKRQSLFFSVRNAAHYLGQLDLIANRKGR